MIIILIKIRKVFIVQRKLFVRFSTTPHVATADGVHMHALTIIWNLVVQDHKLAINPHRE